MGFCQHHTFYLTFEAHARYKLHQPSFAIFVGVQVPVWAISLVDMYVWIKTNTGWWEQEQSAGSAGVCWASAAAAAVTDTCTASSRI